MNGHHYILGSKRKLQKENDSTEPPKKLPFCKYGNFVPATTTDIKDECYDKSKNDEKNQESKIISSKDLLSNDCQSVTKIVTTQNESNSRGRAENGKLQLS